MGAPGAGAPPKFKAHLPTHFLLDRQSCSSASLASY